MKKRKSMASLLIAAILLASPIQALANAVPIEQALIGVPVPSTHALTQHVALTGPVIVSPINANTQNRVQTFAKDDYVMPSSFISGEANNVTVNIKVGRSVTSPNFYKYVMTYSAGGCKNCNSPRYYTDIELWAKDGTLAGQKQSIIVNDSGSASRLVIEGISNVEKEFEINYRPMYLNQGAGSEQTQFTVSNTIICANCGYSESTRAFGVDMPVSSTDIGDFTTDNVYQYPGTYFLYTPGVTNLAWNCEDDMLTFRNEVMWYHLPYAQAIVDNAEYSKLTEGLPVTTIELSPNTPVACPINTDGFIVASIRIMNNDIKIASEAIAGGLEVGAYIIKDTIQPNQKIKAVLPDGTDRYLTLKSIGNASEIVTEVVPPGTAFYLEVEEIGSQLKTKTYQIGETGIVTIPVEEWNNPLSFQDPDGKIVSVRSTDRANNYQLDFVNIDVDEEPPTNPEIWGGEYLSKEPIYIKITPGTDASNIVTTYYILKNGKETEELVSDAQVVADFKVNKGTTWRLWDEAEWYPAEQDKFVIDGSVEGTFTLYAVSEDPFGNCSVARKHFIIDKSSPETINIPDICKPTNNITNEDWICDLSSIANYDLTGILHIAMIAREKMDVIPDDFVGPQEVATAILYDESMGTSWDVVKKGVLDRHGIFEVYIAVLKANGNESIGDIYTITIDKIAPAQPVLGFTKEGPYLTTDIALINRNMYEVTDTVRYALIDKNTSGTPAVDIISEDEWIDFPMGDIDKNALWTNVLPGDYFLVAEVEDLAGNISPRAVMEFSKDHTAPTAPIIAKTDIVDGVQISVDGSTDDYSGVTYYISYRKPGSGLTTPKEYTVPLEFTEPGDYMFYCYAQDEIGNKSAVSNITFSIAYEEIPELGNIVINPDNSLNDDFYDKTNPNLIGEAACVAVDTAPGSADWEDLAFFQVTTEEGYWHVLARVYDQRVPSVVKQSKPMLVLNDYTPPVDTEVLASVREQEVTITVNPGTDALSGVQYTEYKVVRDGVLGSSVDWVKSDNPNQMVKTYTLAPGNYTVFARATDKKDNTSSTVSKAFTVNEPVEEPGSGDGDGDSGEGNGSGDSNENEGDNIIPKPPIIDGDNENNNGNEGDEIIIGGDSGGNDIVIGDGGNNDNIIWNGSNDPSQNTVTPTTKKPEEPTINITKQDDGTVKVTVEGSGDENGMVNIYLDGERIKKVAADKKYHFEITDKGKHEVEAYELYKGKKSDVCSRVVSVNANSSANNPNQKYDDTYVIPSISKGEVRITGLVEGIKLKNSALRDGYINGYEDNTFRPDNPVTRAEFATMMSNLLRYNNCYNGPITGLGTQKWAEDSFRKMIYYGSLPTGAGYNVRASDNLTKGEFCFAITSVLNLTGTSERTVTSVENYVHKEQVYKMMDLGLIDLDVTGSFDPGQKITRGEVVKALNDLFMKESSRQSTTLFKDVSENSTYYLDVKKASR